MATPHGIHVWYELLTGDVDAAADFYCKAVGWTASSFAQAASDAEPYTILSAGSEGVAGMMKNPMPTGPVWLGYVGVSDVDAAVTQLKELGGKVHRPAWDLEGVGRMAFVADPQGAAFYVMRGASEMDSKAFLPTTDGHCAWNELYAAEQGAALAFYAQMFGWEKGGAMPMGELGDYTFINHGGAMIGAVMNKPAEAPSVAWNYYFRVSGIDAAVRRIEAGGGTVVVGPQEVPGGEWVINAIDPQGGTFGLVGSK
jgi:predicted enzyme related to lactoylglutathione lyase